MAPPHSRGAWGPNAEHRLPELGLAVISMHISMHPELFITALMCILFCGAAPGARSTFRQRESYRSGIPWLRSAEGLGHRGGFILSVTKSQGARR